jgi:hypothetical protein
MHLNTIFCNASIKNKYHGSAKLSYKYMKVKYQLELLYVQVDESLKCMDIVLNFSYSNHNLSKF